MEYNKKPGAVQSFIEYLPRALKFYSLKNEFLARFVFVLVLAANISSQLYIYRNIDIEILLTYPETRAQLEQLISNYSTMFVISVIRDIAVSIISAFYLLTYIKELRGEPVNMTEITGQVSRKMLPFIFAYMVTSVLQGLGLLFFVVPGIIIHILFLFNTCLIIDNKSGFLASFGKSISLSEGYRRQIFSVIVFIFILFNAASMFLGSFGSVAAGSVITSFITTIERITTLRIVALIYVDLYDKKHNRLPNDMIAE